MNIPEEVTKAFNESKKYFPTPLQEFQFYDKYSRFDYRLGRRETWVETCKRSVNFLIEISKNQLPKEEYARIEKFMLEMKATPSMRLIAMAGPAARRNNMAIYNCSYLPIDSIDALVEQLLIAMAGCGVGFSVERQYISQFSEVKPQTGEILPAFTIPDSTEGWAEALRIGLTTWFNGKNMEFDYSLVRSAGVPLKIKGGRASGPEPLKSLLDFSRTVILRRQGEKVRPIDAHDIACKIGEAIVSGGVRRTALISLFDIDDQEMRNAKNGDLSGNEQRWMANNSAVWHEEMTQDRVLDQMYEMIKGQRGEPGIFSRHNANTIIPERRKKFGFKEYGTNPCGEINLRPYEFCNLSIAIARKEDTLESLMEKVEVATIIGTLQSMATHFPGLRPIWKQNCEEERLLGVDINGQMDSQIVQDPKVMEKLKHHAIVTNSKYAEVLNIPQSASVTCVKPSGNSSQLFNCSSGLHARWSKYYVRNVRVQAESPLKKILEDIKAPMDPENGQTIDNANTYVIHFPVKSPDGAIVRADRDAIEQCEYWLRSKRYWTEHNPSVTIGYSGNEVIDLINWVWNHRDLIGGMSFLPNEDARYNQMPYEEITEDEYNEKIEDFPDLDFSKIYLFEKEDHTSAAQEVACLAGSCEIDPFVKFP